MTVVLIREYRGLCLQVAKVRALQEQYYGYLHIVQRMGGSSKSVNLSDTTFCTVNRSQSHLKESTISYLHDHQLDEEVVVSENPPVSDQGVIPYWAQTPRRDAETDITFLCPLDQSSFWISSLFGARKKPNGQIGFHHGIDMAAQRGTQVHASAAGTVEYAGYAPGYGNTVVIVHDAVYKTRYAHLDAIHVQKNQIVTQGSTIGAVGDTGFTIKQGHDASHLHFELYEQGKQVNPLALISV